MAAGDVGKAAWRAQLEKSGSAEFVRRRGWEGQEEGAQQACRLAWGHEGERSERGEHSHRGREEESGECGRNGSRVHCPGK